MASKGAAKWVEMGRKELGLYASGPVSGPGWSNGGYFQIVYEVTERRQPPVASRRWEDNYRTRAESGPACRLYGEGYEAFCQLYRTYAAHARAHAETHKDTHDYCFDRRFKFENKAKRRRGVK